MGQRANYIVKSKGKIDIYYTHWRANLIVKDLLMGPAQFLEFIKRFDTVDELIQDPWIEGFVILDLDAKRMVFKEESILYQTSMLEAFLLKLKPKWPDWKVEWAIDGYYRLKEEIDSTYIAKHSTEFEACKIEDLEPEGVDYINSVSIIKEANGEISLKNLRPEMASWVLLGPSIIPFLKNQASDVLLPESKMIFGLAVLLDEQSKRITLAEGVIGLLEKVQEMWPDWEVEVQELGYIGMLQKAGIETEALKLSQEEITAELDAIINSRDNFDPFDTATRIIKDHPSAKFNPAFFEDIKPSKMSWWERVKAMFKED